MRREHRIGLLRVRVRVRVRDRVRDRDRVRLLGWVGVGAAMQVAGELGVVLRDIGVRVRVRVRV